MTKETLKTYTKLKREQKQLEGMLRELEAIMAAPSGQRLTGMPRNPSPGGNPLEDAVIRHVELQERYRAKLDELLQAQLEIERAIDTLDPTERTLLRLHYIQGETWEQAAVTMNYSWRQVHRIHARALKKLESI
jgi:RNA polymerase sigma factor (sigma-70 family)